MIGSKPGFCSHAPRLPPHRSPTQTFTPSLSMYTALVDPHSLPSGSCPHTPSTVRYGFGIQF